MSGHRDPQRADGPASFRGGPQGGGGQTGPGRAPTRRAHRGARDRTDVGPHGADPRVTVVLLTHDRPDELARTLRRLRELPERPAVVVVDNASARNLAPVLARQPGVELVRSRRNLGAAGRNLGVARVRTPYVAFCDDDTWWAPGALAHAAGLLDAHPAVAVLSARVLVGEGEAEDPTCAAMAASPLDAHGLPGPALVSFMAGACVMRTAAYRAAGGYEPRLFLGAEELLMSLDIAALGGRIVYAPEVVTHHHPSDRARDPRRRCIAVARNRLWIACMRLPWGLAWALAREALGQVATSAVPLAQAALADLEALIEYVAAELWPAGQEQTLPPGAEPDWRAQDNQ